MPSGYARQFEIIDEALGRIRREDTAVAATIPCLNAIIGTRNLIAHQYGDVDHVGVWTMITTDLPALIEALKSQLLRDDTLPTVELDNCCCADFATTILWIEEDLEMTSFTDGPPGVTDKILIHLGNIDRAAM